MIMEYIHITDNMQAPNKHNTDTELQKQLYRCAEVAEFFFFFFFNVTVLLYRIDEAGVDENDGKWFWTSRPLALSGF